jgi:hypothetical protein
MPAPDNAYGAFGGMKTGSGRNKACIIATSSTTNPTWHPGIKPGRRGGKAATNSLSYGSATEETY